MVREDRMVRFFRWLAALGIMMGGLVACGGPQPTCPTCPIADFQLLGPANLLGDTQPASGQTWGRVELLLSPQAGSSWSIPASKLSANGDGYSFSSQANESNVITVFLVGKAEGDNVNVTTMSVSVWLGASDIKSLVSSTGLKLRMRLDKDVQNIQFNIKGYVYQAGPKDPTTGISRESCKGEYVGSEGGSFGTSSGIITLKDECSDNASSGCWKTCSD